MTRERITITVDAELVALVNNAVARGETRSVSSWINDAIAARVARDQRLAALADAVAEYEADRGAFTAEELDARVEADRHAAAAVRTQRRGRRRSA